MRLRRHRTELTSRVHTLSRIALLALAVIGIGYWSVQVAEGAKYRELADHNRLRKLTVDASRGLIRDRHGRPLVENVPSYSLLLDRSRGRDRQESLQFAGGILGVEVQELETVLAAAGGSSRFVPVRLAQNLSLEQVARFSVHHLEHPEFEIKVDQLRLYRYAHQMAHLLGYLREATAEDLAQDESPYRAGELVGRTGLEKFYETMLRGRSGEQVVVVDSRGQKIEEFDSLAAETGVDLKLTLDLDLQQLAAELLEGKVGSLVAMDPRNGEILAMVSTPSYDPNRFAYRLNQKDWSDLRSHPHKPLQNRAIHNVYPPGSVFKLVMAAAVLEEKVVDPSKRVFCRGYSMIYDHRYRCHNSGGHGWVDLEDSLKYSCNVYFHQAGQKLGVDTISKYARAFGMGSRTGIDLQGERTGLVPSSRWSQEVRKKPWYPGETISVATGQGPIEASSLQMAVMTAAVANDGQRVIPHLTLDAKPKAGKVPHVGVSNANLARIRQGMWEVVNGERGTGHFAKIEALGVAGKTGTAQVVRQETWTKNEQLAPEFRDHAWFTSFAPFDDPKLVVVVFVEHGGGGSKAAAPLAKRIYAEYFKADLADHDQG